MKLHEQIMREIKRRKLSVASASLALGIGRPALSNVVNGNADLSINLALKLEKTFNMKARKMLIKQLDEAIQLEKREMQSG